MKNGLLIWNIVLTLVAGYLLFTHLSAKKKDAATTKAAGSDTTMMKKEFRIAYFEMDSVEENFDMVKDKKAELNKEEETINSELDKLGRNFQQRYNYYQNQAQAGAMTQAQQEEAARELKALDESNKNKKMVMEQNYQEHVSRVNKEMKTTIEDFLKEYNKTKGYSYIFANEAGLFYYRDSAYNITGDVVKGLNILYRKKGKQ